MRNIFKKSIPLWLAFVIMMAMVMATAVALNIRALTIQKINLFGGQIQESMFIIASIDSKIKGKNKVEVNLIVKNTDTSAHSAEVTVQLLDSNGDIIKIDNSQMESMQTITNIAGGETQDMTYEFQGKDLASQYAQSFVVIKET